MKTKLLILLLALLMQGCETTKEPPLYGPWDVKNLDNAQLDVLLRNVYSDGWRDAMKINEL